MVWNTLILRAITRKSSDLVSPLWAGEKLAEPLLQPITSYIRKVLVLIIIFNYRDSTAMKS